MATENNLFVDGVNFVSTNDFRNSTYSGTTRMGPNGSGQFLAVRASTVSAGVAYQTTASGIGGYGICQNKPNVGEAMAIAFFGASKAVAGSTIITAGGDLMVDSSGCLVPYSSAAGVARFGRQVGPTLPAAIGEVFTAAIYGFGLGGGSIA